MNVYLGIALVCIAYFGAFYLLLQQATGENNYGMYVLALFFGLFLFLGLGGIECLIGMFTRKEQD